MPAEAPTSRPSSLRKRTAALAAGRVLFLEEGYERTSVDAIAARAGISKRTVYDYFGDKDRLFDAVIHDVATEVSQELRLAADEELRADRDVRDSLLAFIRRIVTGTFASSEYRLLRQLVLVDPRTSRGFGELDNLPETLLAELFEELTTRHVLRAPNAHRAAQQFVALTFLLAVDVIRTSRGEEADIDSVLVDGVDTFLRAYRA